MRKLILQAEKRCFICGSSGGLHHHEIMFGTADRKKSIKYGLQLWLCGPHHNLGNYSPHHNREVDIVLKKYGQQKFEEVYGHELWMKEFHRNYL